MNRLVKLMVGVALSLVGLSAQDFKVSTFLTCADLDPGGNTVTAYFGYESLETSNITLPVGTINRFIPDPEFKGQPTTFFPGYHEKAFRVKFPADDFVVWSFLGTAAAVTVLDVSSHPCTPPPPSLPPGVVGKPYAQQLSAIGGTSPLAWSPVSGFPTGVTVSSAGLVNGTPLQSGQFTVTVQATDAFTTVKRTYQLPIASGLTINDPASMRAPGFSPQFRVVTTPTATVNASANCNLDEFVITGGGTCTVPNSNTIQGRVASSGPSGNGWSVSCSGGTATAVAVCSLK